MGKDKGFKTKGGTPIVIGPVPASVPEEQIYKRKE